MMKTFAAVAIPVAMLANPVAAQADIGGQVPGPGLCDYPAVCDVGAEFGAYHYWSDMPVEENGSHHHCAYAGAMVQGLASVSLFMFTAGVTAPIGALEGGCHYVCPDGSLAATPRPPGAWRSAIVPTVCVPLGPPPGGPVPDQLDDQVSPGEPFPTVLTPVPGNPEAITPTGN